MILSQLFSCYITGDHITLIPSCRFHVSQVRTETVLEKAVRPTPLEGQHTSSFMLTASPKQPPAVISQNVHYYPLHFRVGERRGDI